MWGVILATLSDSEISDNTMQMIDSTFVQVHQRSADGRGIQRNGICRSRGGLTTKVHTRANAEGLAIGFNVTPGQTSDMTA